MIRIVFENGGIAEFNNVEKIYIEEKDHDEKVTIVGEIVPIGFADDIMEEDNVRLHNTVTEEEK